MSELSAITAEFAEVQKTFRTKVQEMMKTAFAKFFAAYPEIKGITWTQYAPYFNDGDPCEFSVHEFHHILRDDLYTEDTLGQIQEARRMYDIEEIQPLDSYYNTEDRDFVVDVIGVERYKELVTAWKQISKDLNSVDEAIFEAMFGRDVRVTATAEGFDIDDYDHD